MTDKTAVNPYSSSGKIVNILDQKPDVSYNELAFLLNLDFLSLASLLHDLQDGGLLTWDPPALTAQAKQALAF